MFQKQTYITYEAHYCRNLDSNREFHLGFMPIPLKITILFYFWQISRATKFEEPYSEKYYKKCGKILAIAENK